MNTGFIDFSTAEPTLENSNSVRYDEKRNPVMTPTYSLPQQQQQQQTASHSLPVMPVPCLPMPLSYQHGVQDCFHALDANNQIDTYNASVRQGLNYKSKAEHLTLERSKREEVSLSHPLPSPFSSTCLTSNSIILKKLGKTSLPYRTLEHTDPSTSAMENTMFLPRISESVCDGYVPKYNGRSCFRPSKDTDLASSLSDSKNVDGGDSPLRGTIRKRSISNFEDSSAKYPSTTKCVRKLEVPIVQERSPSMTGTIISELPSVKRMAIDREALTHFKRDPLIPGYHEAVEGIRYQSGEIFSEGIDVEGLHTLPAVGTAQDRHIGHILSEVPMDAGPNRELFVQNCVVGPIGGEIFTCTQCGERFGNAEDWQSHMKNIHVKKFGCTKCPSRFARKYDLKKHTQIVHEKLRPFQCDECQQSFGQKHHLVRHKRALHMKEKSFECPMCLSRFSREEHLHNHCRAVHGTWKPLKCAFCDGEFFDQQAFLEHLGSFCAGRRKTSTFLKWQPEKRSAQPDADYVYEK